MFRVQTHFVAAGLAAIITVSAAAAQSDEPQRSSVTERTGSHLVLIDTLVLDSSGHPVGGLTIDDFEVIVDSHLRTIDSVDLHCDPALEAGSGRVRAGEPLDAAPRRVVIALDYQHLGQLGRVAVLEQLREELPDIIGQDDQVMVTALTGSLRIEQGFTNDSARVLATLDRMEHDISLWLPDFRHLSEQGFIGGLGALFDVLQRVPGPKAVALYSEMQDVPLDLEFAELAAQATTARCAVYPVDAAGLMTPLDEREQRGCG